MDVVITVPHASRAGRTCGRRAAYAAQRIETYLGTHMRMASITLLLPTAEAKQRSAVDLNRAAARCTDWRQRVQALVGSAVARRRRVLLLDVHSFADSADEFGRCGAVPAAVLLDVPGAHDFLPPAGVVALQASLVNDIVVCALRAGADAFLWQFNENARRSTDALIDAVAESMRKHMLGPRYASPATGSRPAARWSSTAVVAPVAGDVCNIDAHCWLARRARTVTLRARAPHQWPSVRSTGAADAPLVAPLHGELVGFVVEYADHAPADADETSRTRVASYALEFRSADAQAVVLLRIRPRDDRPPAGHFVFAPQAINRGARALRFAPGQIVGAVAPGARVDICVSSTGGRVQPEPVLGLRRALTVGTPLYRIKSPTECTERL